MNTIQPQKTPTESRSLYFSAGGGNVFITQGISVDANTHLSKISKIYKFRSKFSTFSWYDDVLHIFYYHWFPEKYSWLNQSSLLRIDFFSFRKDVRYIQQTHQQLMHVRNTTVAKAYAKKYNYALVPDYSVGMGDYGLFVWVKKIKS